MKYIARLIAFVLFSTAFAPAFAADPVYPLGLRIGIVPIEGLVIAKTFPGFETEDQGVRVFMTELPATAYGEVESAFKNNSFPAGAAKPESLHTAAGEGYYTVESGKNGTAAVRRLSMIVSGGSFSGFVAVQVAEDAASTYSDEAVRRMFASVVVRHEVPVEEQLAQMPFKVSDLGNFKNVRTLAVGTAVILADGDETTGFEAAPFMVIGMVGSTPTQPEDRGRFAQQAVTTIPGLRDARITMSEPLRIDGMAGYETRIEATSGKDNTAVTVVQWLRFGSASSLRIIASAPREEWPRAFPRFRAVRDGLQPR